MTTNTNEKIMDLIIKTYPHDNEDHYDITFEIANNTFSPFQQVDYLINGIFKDVNLMNEINSNKLENEEEQKNRKERIYTNGKIIHPIYKITGRPKNKTKRVRFTEDDVVAGEGIDENENMYGGKKNKHRKTKNKTKK